MVFSYIINCFIKLRSSVSAARSLLPPERERGRRGREWEKERAPETVRKIWVWGEKMLPFFFNDGERVLIGCFPSHLSWCNNHSCSFLSGGYKGAGLHQLLIQVILITNLIDKSVFFLIIPYLSIIDQLIECWK